MRTSPDERTRQLAREVEADFENSQARLNLGDANAKQGSYDDPAPSGQVSVCEVLEEFRRGVELHVGREDLQARFDLGTAYSEMGLLDEAIFELDLAVADPALAPHAHWMKAKCHRSAGRLELAVQSLGYAIKAGRSDREKALYFYDLCCVLVEQGQEPKARQSFKQVLALAPNAPWKYPGEDQPVFKAAREAFASGGSRDAYRSTRDEESFADDSDDIDALEARLRATPEDVTARVEFARLLAEDQQIADARTQYRIATRQYRRDGDEPKAIACEIQAVALASAQVETTVPERRCSFCDTPADPLRPPARMRSTILCADCLLEADTLIN